MLNYDQLRQQWLDESEAEKAAARKLPPIDEVYQLGSSNLRTARSVSDRAYAGLICPKHPYMIGVRRKSDGKCLECARELRQARKAKPEVRARINLEKADKRLAEAVDRRNLELACRAEMLRCEKLALADRDPDPAAWRRYCTNQTVLDFFKPKAVKVPVPSGRLMKTA